MGKKKLNDKVRFDSKPVILLKHHLSQPSKIKLEEDVKDFCQGQIAHYKIPRYVRIRSELPMTVSGKAQKFKMREEMIDELNLTETKTA